jgi:hypothetical protein
MEGPVLFFLGRGCLLLEAKQTSARNWRGIVKREHGGKSETALIPIALSCPQNRTARRVGSKTRL